MIRFFVLPFICLLTFAGGVSASSLSELNTKGFQDRAVPVAKSSENPFVRQNISSEELLIEDLNLTGIVYRSDDSFALISGYVVKEGDDIAGYKVKGIERDHVVLRQLDQVKVLRLE
jgi:hypothetical protein